MLQVNERILLVDDDELICKTYAKALNQSGFKCSTAGSAETALDVLRQEEFALLLLDIGLPGKTGSALVSELTRQYPDMAIVMVTGHDEMSTVLLAMREGAYDYLTKPVPQGLLLLRVEKALERRALMLENKAYHVGDKAFDVAGLETLIGELSLRLEQAKREEAARKELEKARREQAAQTQEESADHALSDFSVEDGSVPELPENIGEAVSQLIRSGELNPDGNLGGRVSRGSATTFVKTGEMVLDEKLGGGLPRGSLTLIEGSSSTGKSVLCQHLMYGALMDEARVACFTSEFTFQSLLTQMHSIGLDASKCPKGAQLTVNALQEPLPEDDGDPLLSELGREMEILAANVDFIVLDTITNLASYSGERPILSFFAACKRICTKGTTIVVVAHSSAFDEKMAVRIRAMCDGNLNLRVENIGDKLMNALEVRKILNAERSTGNVVFFEVEPGMGIRPNPFSRAKV